MDAITVSPPNPDSRTPVTISVTWGGCIIDTGMENTAHTFHIHFNYSNICFSAPPGGVSDISIGVLQPGSYNVVYDILTEGVLQLTFTKSFLVTPAVGTQVPTFGAGAACILVLSLVVGAVLFRRGSKANYSLKRTAADGLR